MNQISIEAYILFSDNNPLHVLMFCTISTYEHKHNLATGWASSKNLDFHVTCRNLKLSSN